MGDNIEKDETVFDSMTENNFDSSENEAPDTSTEDITLPHSLELQYPVELKEGVKLTRLLFSHVPTASMMAHMPLPGTTVIKYGHYLPIIAGMTGESQVTIGKVKAPDLDACFGVLRPFLFSGQGGE